MERRRRRLSTIAVSAAASLIILAAAASGLFQIVVQAVPGYRADVERYVSDLTGRPVRIDALGLTWRYYYPSLELVGVALLAEDGATPVLQAERLRLGFGLTRLARGETLPNRLELHGLALDVRIDLDGEVQVKGIGDGAGAAPSEPLAALRPLTRFAQVRLERCRLNVRDERRGNQTFSFGIVHAELDRGLLGDALDAEVTLPASIGDTALFEAEFSGELLEPATWSGRGTVELAGLVAGAWVAPYLVRGATIEVVGAEARLEAQVVDGTVKALDARLVTGAVSGRRARHKADIDALDARLSVSFADDGWLAQLAHVAIESKGERWPATSGTLRATHTAGGTVVYDGHLSYARLSDLAPWLQMLPVPASIAALDAAAGDLRDLQVRMHAGGDEQRYGYRARFENLALPAAERPAGFSGLRGEAAGDERGGRAVLQESRVTLDLPGMLVTPRVPLEAFEAELEWRRRQAGWEIGMPQFRWALWTTRGRGRFALQLPDAPERSPELDLVADFQAEDATRAKPLMPLAWGTALRGWLDRAIVSARAPRATLRIKGPLADFPFDDPATGAWSLDIEASDVLLAYQPDWPAIENVAAKLHFSGNALAIEATSGTVAGSPLQRATARFPDLATGQLLVDGSVAGETARFYDFLARSPLRETFAGLLSQTQASGPATVGVHLDIPVREASQTRTSGRVTLGGVELRHGALPQPIRDIRGVIDFTADGLTSERLTGTLYDVPIRATLAPQPGGGSLLDAAFRVALDAAGTGVSEWVPAWVRKNVSGASEWRARLPIGVANDAALRLTSDMVGLAVALPSPLGKAANEAVPLALTVGAAERAPLRVTAEYQDRLGADLRFARNRSALALERGTLRIGAGPPMAPEERGLVIGGHVNDLDLRAWAAKLKGTGLEQQFSVVKRADLHLGRAVWDRYALRDARYQWSSLDDGWTVALVGAGGIGEIRWSDATGGVLTARMDQLGLDLLPVSEADETTGEPIDPNALPRFDVDVRRLLIGPADLGHVTLLTQRSELGQKLQTLKVEGGIVTLGGTGEWRRRSGQSSATLSAEFATSDISLLLSAFGYTPNLDARIARVRGGLSWLPSARGIEWHQGQGTVNFDFEDGQLRAVEPGAGRVLGLVNFYALPRRLTLNFRDVLGSGLGFDRITGDFELRDGHARTQNLRIAGPSLRMEVRGRIGLAARDYDQQVTVYPDVSAGVTLGAALLGGPVAGALALIAQEVLNKPLNQVTQLSYRVTGTWDNPQVDRADGTGTPPPPRVP